MAAAGADAAGGNAGGQDLPIELPTKFKFVVNMKTAKALGLAVPYSLQLLADEIIR